MRMDGWLHEWYVYVCVCVGGRERRVRDHRHGRRVGCGGQQPRRADGAEPAGQVLVLVVLFVLFDGLVSAGGLAHRGQVRAQSVGEALAHDRRHHLHCHQAGPVEQRGRSG